MGRSHEAVRIEDLLTHAEWLRRLAARLVRDADPDDLVQETWVAALRTPPRDGQPTRPWLAEVLRNFARRRWRAADVRRRGAEIVAAAPETPETPEALFERARVQRDLASLVLELDEPFRTAVLLRHFEGRSAAEMAGELGVAEGTARWRVSEGLARLRARLDAKHGGRERWRASFVSLAGRRVAPSPGRSSKGDLAMATAVSTKVKVGAVAALVLLALVGGGVVWRRAQGVGGGDPLAALPPAGGRPITNAADFVVEPAPLRAATATIEGRVVDPNGAGIAGAVVTLASGTAAEAVVTTDAHGRFAFAGLLPGRKRVAATSANWAAATSPPFALDEGERKPITLTLMSGGVTLSGRVVDVGGGAIAGAAVSATLGYPWLASGPRRVFRTIADAHGRYQLRLLPREYEVRIEANGYVEARSAIALTRDLAREHRLMPAGGLIGRVIDAATGQPVAGVSIKPASVADAPDILSNADGRFHLTGLSGGRVQIRARKGRSIGVGRMVTVSALQTVDCGDVAMSRAAIVAGFVKNASGAGIAGATVYLRGVRGLSHVSEAVTSSRGRFVLEAVDPGAYEIGAFHAETKLAADPRGLTVTGEGVDDIELVTHEGGQVAGRVLDGSGDPQSDVLVTVGPTEKSRQRWPRGVETDVDGRFVIAAVPTDPGAVLAWHPQLGVAEARFTSVASGERRTVDLTLAEGASIVGVVRHDDGTPAPAASVALTRQKGNVIYTSATPDENGRFAFDKLVAGEYLVHATKGAPGNRWTVRRTADLSRFSLAEGERRHDVVLVLPAGGRRLAGFVLLADGKPAFGARVAARPDSGDIDWRSSTSAVTDEAGRFELLDVDAGTFQVRAALAGHPPTVIAGVAAGRTDLTLKLPAAASVAGVVTSPAGSPVTAFTVHAVWREGSDAEQRRRRMDVELFGVAEQVRDARGSFDLTGLEAGAQEIVVRLPDGGGTSQTVTLGPGERKTGLRLVAGQAVTARGRIVDFDTGAPIAGAQLDVKGSRDAHVTTDAHGRFELPHATPGQMLRLEVRPSGATHIPELFEITPRADALDLGDLRVLAGDPGRFATAGDLGVSPSAAGGSLIVGAIKDDGPAARAGLRPGDAVIAVEGRDVRGMGPGAVRFLVSRPPGQTVSLRVQGPGAGPRDVSVTLAPRSRP